MDWPQFHDLQSKQTKHNIRRKNMKSTMSNYKNHPYYKRNYYMLYIRNLNVVELFKPH